MVKKSFNKKSDEFVYYIGLSAYRHEKQLALGITNRDLLERQGERGYTSLVGYGLPLGTTERKVAQQIEKKILNYFLETVWITRGYVSHPKTRGKDWITISPNAKGDISYAYFLQFVINYACEKCEAFKEGLSK
tara:strand:- start:1584 stop:1985 length:402 start_codon:yes stop_codon:yes gene_type:complete